MVSRRGGGGQRRTVGRRRTPDDFAGHPVEVRQRLEPGLVRNLAHTQVRIKQKIFRFFHTRPGDEFSEGDSCRSFDTCPTRSALRSVVHSRSLLDPSRLLFTQFCIRGVQDR